MMPWYEVVPICVVYSVVGWRMLFRQWWGYFKRDRFSNLRCDDTERLIFSSFDIFTTFRCSTRRGASYCGRC